MSSFGTPFVTRATAWPGSWSFAAPLGPKGARVYRVQVRQKPHPAYTEVLEQQLEVVEGKKKGSD